MIDQMLAQISAGGPAAWLFIPSCILLGALHGLEPGHSKTMMAAFIVAVRGTVSQAVVLALCATLSHTAIVWLIAILGLTFGQRWTSAANEPYFQLISALIIISLAVWMLTRTWQEQHPKKPAHGHHHPHGHDHHDHDGQSHDHDDLGPEELDAHARAHAVEIETRFAGRTVSMGEVAMFGLTGGLMPCSAAVTVLLLCLQVHQFWLGMTLVLFFSIGLAITLLGFGVTAAWAMRHVHKRWPGLEAWTRRAPYLSSVLVIVIGVAVGVQAVIGLRGG